MHVSFLSTMVHMHPPPFFGQKAFFRGRGVVYVLEAPRSKSFIPPPSSIHPPPLEGCFQGRGGGCV